MTIAVALGAALAASACTTSETLGFDDGGGSTAGSKGGSVTGSAGTNSSSDAGTSGAGTMGAAGTTASSGAAGTSIPAGGAGTTGTSSGAAGTTGTKVDAGAPDKSTGAAGTGATTNPALTYTSYIGPILTNNGCGGCHYIAQNGVPPYMGGFGLSYENFMAAVTPAHAGCPNLDASKRRVVPGDPDHSLIYIKISVANLPGSCGGHMPYMGTSLSATYQMKVREWIMNGAPK